MRQRWARTGPIQSSFRYEVAPHSSDLETHEMKAKCLSADRVRVLTQCAEAKALVEFDRASVLTQYVKPQKRCSLPSRADNRLHQGGPTPCPRNDRRT